MQPTGACIGSFEHRWYTEPWRDDVQRRERYGALSGTQACTEYGFPRYHTKEEKAPPDGAVHNQGVSPLQY